MTVGVLVDADAPPWQARVVASLRAAAEVRVVGVPGTPPAEPLSFLARLYARLDRWPAPAPVAGGEHALGAVDVVVDLTAAGTAAAAPLVLRPDPVELDEAALLRALAARAPTLVVRVRARGEEGESRVAAESTVKLARFSARVSSDRLAARLGELVARALARAERTGVRPGSDPGSRPGEGAATALSSFPAPTPVRVLRLLAAGAGAAVRVRTTTIEWRVAVGEADPDDPFRIPRRLRPLRPPEGRFYADPMLVHGHEGTFAFVEDFDLRAGYATISAVDVASGAVTPVLDTGTHLSYPFVFEADGARYLIPESAAAREVALYRCESFPDRWARAALLFDGVEAYDTTLVHHDALWWLFFATGTPGAGADDELHVWYAESIGGPWSAHPRNPVKSTPYGSRPAGPIVSAGGRLLRPGQDGAREYGSGIVVHEIERLTTDDYRESAVRRLDGASFRARGIHTVSHGGGLVAVDTKHSPLRRPRAC